MDIEEYNKINRIIKNMDFQIEELKKEGISPYHPISRLGFLEWLKQKL